MCIVFIIHVLLAGLFGPNVWAHRMRRAWATLLLLLSAITTAAIYDVRWLFQALKRSDDAQRPSFSISRRGNTWEPWSIRWLNFDRDNLVLPTRDNTEETSPPPPSSGAQAPSTPVRSVGSSPSAPPSNAASSTTQSRLSRLSQRSLTTIIRDAAGAPELN